MTLVIHGPSTDVETNRSVAGIDVVADPHEQVLYDLESRLYYVAVTDLTDGESPVDMWYLGKQWEGDWKDCWEGGNDIDGGWWGCSFEFDC